MFFWELFMVRTAFCLFGIYLLWVIYKLLAGARNLFALYHNRVKVFSLGTATAVLDICQSLLPKLPQK